MEEAKQLLLTQAGGLTELVALAACCDSTSPAITVRWQLPANYIGA